MDSRLTGDLDPALELCQLIVVLIKVIDLLPDDVDLTKGAVVVKSLKCPLQTSEPPF